MPDQTPVQIAWVTQDLDATEKALTTLLGAKKWIRIPAVHFGPDTCTYRGRPAAFVADISPEIRAFFDYVKQEQA
jgi:hypothetical protein